MHRQEWFSKKYLEEPWEEFSQKLLENLVRKFFILCSGKNWITFSRMLTGVSGSVPGGNHEENVEEVHGEKYIIDFILGEIFKILLAKLVKGMSPPR